MKICDFTVPELDKLRKECNFTKEERFLFELRAEDIPLEQCAEIMNISASTVYRLSKKVKIKVKKLL